MAKASPAAQKLDVFERGMFVRHKREAGRRGMVSEVYPVEGLTRSVRVFFDGTNHPWMDPADVEYLPPFNTRRVTSPELLRELALAKYRYRLSDSLYSFGTSRTEFAAYQFRPVLKFLRAWQEEGKRGILIADEVGLGKTIEAAIILQELKARTSVERVLIVCPSKLTRKWQDEQRLRFNESFHVWTSDDVRRLMQYDTVPPFRAIASLEMLRHANIFEMLQDERLRLDCLIVDESHYMRNADSRSYKLGQRLADIADAVVLLSATPVHLANDNLRNLLQLIDPAEYRDQDLFRALLEPNRYINEAAALVANGRPMLVRDTLRNVEQTAIRDRFLHNPWYQDLLVELSSLGPTMSSEEKARIQHSIMGLNTFAGVLNRTRKREFQDIPVREATTIRVTYTPAERALYEAIDRHVRARLKEIHDKAIGFATVMRERQAASCLPVMGNLLQAIADDTLANLYEQTEFDPDFGGDSPTQTGKTTRRSTSTSTSMRALIDQAGHLTADSKYDLLETQIRSILDEAPGRKILLFSYFKRTLEYLQRRLSTSGFRTTTIHGGVAMRDRLARIDDFRAAPEGRILLSSEVGAEGLDFQFCDVLINYDLPWNPMQIEQRIGRLDRFGRDATKKVRILNFFIEDTIETRIFERLFERIQIFEHSIGELEDILGNVVSNLTDAMLSPDLTPQQLEERAQRELTRIANEQMENERFQQQEQALIGQGKLLDARIQDTIAHGRVITGHEVATLVTTWLEDAYGAAAYTHDDEELGGIVHVNSTLGRDFDRFCERKQFAPPVESHLIQAKAAGRPCPVTFDPETAERRRSVEFITIHHPLARMAIEHWHERTVEDGSIPLASLELTGAPDEAGPAWFFVYRVQILSVQERDQLEVVVLHEQSKAELHQTASTLLHHLQQLSARDVDSPPHVLADAETWSAKAQVLMERRKLHLEEQEQQYFHVRASELKASLRATADARTRRVEESMATVSDANIRRMRRAQIANVQEETERRIADIDARTSPTVQYQPIAAGRLVIVPDPALARHSGRGFSSLTQRWAGRR